MIGRGKGPSTPPAHFQSARTEVVVTQRHEGEVSEFSPKNREGRVRFKDTKRTIPFHIDSVLGDISKMEFAIGQKVSFETDTDWQTNKRRAVKVIRL